MPVFTGREQFRNAGVTTLAGNITSSATTFTVVDGTQLPPVAPFRTKIGSELLLVRTVAGNVYSDVIRGAENTVPAAHTAGDTVSHGITAMSLRGLPVGRLAWNKNKVPSLSQFAQYNATGVASEDDAGIVLTLPARGSGFWLTGFYQAAPAPPYTVTASFQMVSMHKNLLGFGMMWVQAGGKVATFDAIAINNETCELSNRKADSGNVYNSGYQFLRVAGWPRWMRLSDDGVNRKCWLSADGQYWLEIHSVARLDFLTAGPSNIGFQAYSENVATPNHGVILRCLSWDVVV